MLSVAITATWPATWPPSASAFSTTGSVVAGRTRPFTPSRRQASSRAATGSLVPSISPANTRLPRACPASSSSANRNSKAEASREPGSARATRHMRRSPGGMM